MVARVLVAQRLYKPPEGPAEKSDGFDSYAFRLLTAALCGLQENIPSPRRGLTASYAVQ